MVSNKKQLYNDSYYKVENSGGKFMEVKKTKKFKSKWGFILSCVGSAVGMANVWGFPCNHVNLNFSF